VTSSRSTERDVQAGQRGRDETRARILAVATELFARDGFDNTTVRAIAEGCNLTDPALYYYYPSKRALLNALWEWPEAEALKNVPLADHLTHDRLMALIDLMLDSLVQQDAIVRLMVRGVLDGDQTATALRNQTVAYWRHELLPHFETCFAAAEAAQHVDALIALMTGVAFSTQMEHLDDLADYVNMPAFRAHIKKLVSVAIPLTGCGAQT
jgi:AcrR family transcriptional regulator